MADDTDPQADEVLVVGAGPLLPRRVSRWAGRVPRAVWLALAAAATVLMAVQVLGTSAVAPVTSASTSTSGPATDLGPLAYIRTVAEGDELYDYVLTQAAPGDCPAVTTEGAPQRALDQAVRRALPRFTILDHGSTLDEVAALCELRARAYDRAGTVLVIAIIAPPSYRLPAGVGQLSVTARVDGTNALTSATSVNRAGWSVTIGSDGPSTDEPARGELTSLAQDPALSW